MTLDISKGHFVDGKIDLEKAVRRIRKLTAQDSIGEIIKNGVRLMVLVKATGNFAFLIATK